MLDFVVALYKMVLNDAQKYPLKTSTGIQISDGNPTYRTEQYLYGNVIAILCCYKSEIIVASPVTSLPSI